jgi:chemotaxis protein CheZ
VSVVAVSKAAEPDLDALFSGVFAVHVEPPLQVAVNAAATVASDGGDGAQEMVSRIGKMTRALHEGLCALGFDKMIESAASSIPDTRDQLSYVIKMTEQAAERVLNAIDTAKPIQDKLALDAGALSQRWETLFAAQPEVEEFKSLVAETREFLREVPDQTQATDSQLTEIMMAQDFQDLTGQVIKKITGVVQEVESQLLALLLDNAAPAIRHEAAGLLNGPVIDGVGRTDVVNNQQQADDLLASLGF